MTSQWKIDNGKHRLQVIFPMTVWARMRAMANVMVVVDMFAVLDHLSGGAVE